MGPTIALVAVICLVAGVVMGSLRYMSGESYSVEAFIVVMALLLLAMLVWLGPGTVRCE